MNVLDLMKKSDWEAILLACIFLIVLIVCSIFSRAFGWVCVILLCFIGFIAGYYRFSKKWKDKNNLDNAMEEVLKFMEAKK